MNRDWIFPENHSIYEDHPPHGLFEARRDRNVFLKFLVTNPPRGRPFGGGGVHRNGEERGPNPFIILNYPFFLIRVRTPVHVRFSRAHNHPPEVEFFP
jgi:hypothetical protein